MAAVSQEISSWQIVSWGVGSLLCFRAVVSEAGDCWLLSKGHLGQQVQY